MNDSETQEFCSSMISIDHMLKRFKRWRNFTSNYELRTYTSGCYYLDQYHQWKSDGLVVRDTDNEEQVL